MSRKMFKLLPVVLLDIQLHLMTGESTFLGSGSFCLDFTQELQNSLGLLSLINRLGLLTQVSKFHRKSPGNKKACRKSKWRIETLRVGREADAGPIAFNGGDTHRRCLHSIHLNLCK